jgi:hypothetical protein
MIVGPNASSGSQVARRKFDSPSGQHRRRRHRGHRPSPGDSIDTSYVFLRLAPSWTALPNAVTSAVHDRMPVILHPDSYDLWLDPWMKHVGAASDLLKPCDARLMRCYPVSTRINRVANDDEECSRPLEVAEAAKPGPDPRSDRDPEVVGVRYRALTLAACKLARSIIRYASWWDSACSRSPAATRTRTIRPVCPGIRFTNLGQP